MEKELGEHLSGCFKGCPDSEGFHPSQDGKLSYRLTRRLAHSRCSIKTATWVVEGMNKQMPFCWSERELQKQGSRRAPPGPILSSNAVHVLSGISHFISNSCSSRACIQHLHLPVAQIFWERSFEASQPRVWSTSLWLREEHGQRAWAESGSPAPRRGLAILEDRFS